VDVEAAVGLAYSYYSRAVAAAGLRTVTPLLTRLVWVGGDGRLWTALLQVSGTATLLTDVEALAGDRGAFRDVGTFERIALGVTDEGLHVLAVTTDGRLLHQLEPSPGQMFRDVELVGVGQDAGSFVGVACA
jgi:hypothetical protein